MYNNHCDTQKNRLYVIFAGKMDVEEIRAACTNVLDEAKQLKPGFGIITDLSEFVPTNEDGRMVIQDTMTSLMEIGVKHVVRVIPVEAAVTGLQWQRSSRTAGYQASQALTLADAEAMMDKLQHV